MHPKDLRESREKAKSAQVLKIIRNSVSWTRVVIFAFVWLAISVKRTKKSEEKGGISLIINWKGTHSHGIFSHQIQVVTITTTR